MSKPSGRPTREARKEHKAKKQAAQREQVQQYVYVLGANLAFHNGLSIPLMSEFLSYGEGDPDEHDNLHEHKQDCERQAFKRLAERLKKYFPHLPVRVLLDRLYPNGPVMEQCRSYGWQYMIVLPDKCLATVWQEVQGLRPLQGHHQHRRIWRGRRQQFWWVNGIRYEYERKHLPVHVVVCEESWEEVDPDKAEILTKNARHVWTRASRCAGIRCMSAATSGHVGAGEESRTVCRPRNVGAIITSPLLLQLECHEGLPLFDAPGSRHERLGPAHPSADCE